MKIASFIVPHTGGTWTAALGLHNSLAAHGIAVRFVACGRAVAAGGSTVAGYRRCGYRRTPGSQPAARAEALLGFLPAAGYDGVIIDVLSIRCQPASSAPARPGPYHGGSQHPAPTPSLAGSRRTYTIVISPRMEHDLEVVRASGTGSPHPRAAASIQASASKDTRRSSRWRSLAG
jgi:hypothetical protein